VRPRLRPRPRRIDVRGRLRAPRERATSDKAGYLARGREYREQYTSIDRPEFDELFEADGRVVAAYTLTLHRQDGADERMAVMAVWTVGDDGKVTELREVDAPAA
jgi:hypothetical protein